ncbi:MAG: prenyltransferase/squalene oxidase repeat-containing protein [Motilibacteraceae bacterium]
MPSSRSTGSSRRRRPRSLLAAASAVLTATALAGPIAGASFAAASSSTATSSTTTDPAKVGLYGSADPTYDGVYRQGLALLALHAAGATPDQTAVQWLLAQQCADGGWASFRTSTTTACTPGSEDSNATGMAVQALAALGQTKAARAGTTWLEDQQNADGGVGTNPGAKSDANSTALFVNALLAVGTDPAGVTKNGKSAYDELLALQVPCDAKVAADRGAYAYQPDAGGALTANGYATVQATVAAAGKALPVQPAGAGSPAPTADQVCAAGTPTTATASADYAAGWLAALLEANGGSVPSDFGSGADVGSTANAVLALVATGHATDAQSAVAYLTKNGSTWAADKPAALALMALVAHATGASPTSFGGQDYVARLAATLTVKAAAPTPTPSSSPSATSSAPTPSTTKGATNGTGTASGSTAVGGPTLPRTGGDVGVLLAGLALLGAGAALLALARRRA